jgi:dTDP-glucose pyrophosphorylase
MAAYPTKMNIVIPMAGMGSRFSKAGYSDPKPFIKFLGKTMIEHVVDAIPNFGYYAVKLIFIVQQEHETSHNATALLKSRWPDCEVVLIDGLTEGAACTVLKATHLIDNKDCMAILNSDNIIHFDGHLVGDLLNDHSVDGVILTFEEESDPKWSFAKLANNGYVAEVAEKKAISTHATAGIYFWKHGSNFVSAAKSMMIKNFRTNGEFYVAPVFNENVEGGEHIVITDVREMNGVGTPEDLEAYVAKMESK